MKNLIIRLILVICIYLLTHFSGQINYSDIIITVILFFGLFLTYRENREESLLNTLSNYFFWLTTSVLILLFKNEDIFNIRNIFLTIFLLKLVGVILTYTKFKKIEVTNTILTKVWIFSLSIYLIELILNSTHGTKNLFLYLGIVSSIEIIFILIRLKKWKFKVKSIFTLKD